jgi:hypothetical protein
MPDFVCTLSQFLHLLRQTIVRVRQNENAQSPFWSFLSPHRAFLAFNPLKAERI